MSYHTQKAPCRLPLVGKQYAGMMKIVKGACADCGLCTAVCPAAARYGHKGGTSLEKIIKKGCVQCGMCMQRCPSGAIDYDDDTERFMRDLTKGVPISLLVAPAACSSFADYRQLFGFLKRQGVRSFHNVLLRADITMWAYVEVMRRTANASFISSPCAAVSEYIRQHVPRLQPFLMPVYSPLVCAAVFLKKYRKVSDRLAFLSPCIAKRTEIRAASPGGYNITLGRLKQYIADQGINLSDYAAVDFDDADEGNGLTLGVYSELAACIACHLPADRRFVKISGPDKVYTWLAGYEQAVREGQKLPALLEVYNCTAGCEGGTGVGENQAALAPIDTNFSTGYGLASKNNRQETELLFATFRRNLDLMDFIRWLPPLRLPLLQAGVKRRYAPG